MNRYGMLDDAFALQLVGDVGACPPFTMTTYRRQRTVGGELDLPEEQRRPPEQGRAP